MLKQPTATPCTPRKQYQRPLASWFEELASGLLQVRLPKKQIGLLVETSDLRKHDLCLNIRRGVYVLL